jgi:hypothetical protein
VVAAELERDHRRPDRLLPRSGDRSQRRVNHHYDHCYGDHHRHCYDHHDRHGQRDHHRYGDRDHHCHRDRDHHCHRGRNRHSDGDRHWNEPAAIRWLVERLYPGRASRLVLLN